MSSSQPYDPYIPSQTTGDQSNSRTAAIQAVCVHSTSPKCPPHSPAWRKEYRGTLVIAAEEHNSFIWHVSYCL